MGESQESCLQADREDSAGKETSPKPPCEDYDQHRHGGQQDGQGGHDGLNGQAYDFAQSLGLDKYSQPEKLSPYQFCSSHHHHQCCQQDKPGVCHDHPDYTDYSS